MSTSMVIRRAVKAALTLIIGCGQGKDPKNYHKVKGNLRVDLKNKPKHGGEGNLKFDGKDDHQHEGKVILVLEVEEECEGDDEHEGNDKREIKGDN